MTNLLKIENLSVSFRDDDGLVTEAAKNVSLTLERGEILGIAGESGSGKSSVAMSIPRLLPAPAAFYPSGRILFNGVDLLQMTPQELRAVR
jgi:ABC-type microcin C transport system duplicated ATPase subunit YejF